MRGGLVGQRENHGVFVRWMQGKWGKLLLGIATGFASCGGIILAGETPAKPPSHSVTIEKRMATEVPILAYHDINLALHNPWTMSAEQFDAEMAFLAEHHFHPISLNQLYTAMSEKLPLPVKPIVITFDDGYESTYTRAFPTLTRYGYPFTVFMISGFINRPGYLTLDQLRTMQESGLGVIGSHTVNHVNLTTVAEDEVRMEVRDSKDALTEELKREVSFFAYPGGMYHPSVIRCVNRAGYKLAVTSDPGYASLTGNPLTLHRISIHQGLSNKDLERLLSSSLRR